MAIMNRRAFLAATLGAAAAARLGGFAPEKNQLGLVRSTHPRLSRPASPEDPLDYERVRDMVWQAIRYAGGLEDRIRSGSWVVIKPNIVSLRPMPHYRTGDVTDLRVTRAVVEYVARHSQAARVTVAEGGSYRAPHDPTPDSVVMQNGRHTDALNFDWGAQEFPGLAGSLADVLHGASAAFPAKRFDYVDLSYDAVRDPAGTFQRIEVPRSATGVGGFGERTDYFVTNAIRNCDFLISVPVMKVHLMCGITACLKNYVGTAPRQCYASPGGFSNDRLHAQHSLDGRIDSFITDLAAFHPPDFNVVDGIRGLQYEEHGNGKPDQMIRSNLILAGRDPVATDALVARLVGFQPWDIEFLHMASQRAMGTFDLGRVKVTGDDPSPLFARWAKPKGWFGRCNREWRVTRDPSAPVAEWSPYQAPTDTLHFTRWPGAGGPAPAYAAATHVRAGESRKVWLWMGVHGRAVAWLNDQKVLEEENLTRYRIGQFRKAVELRSGDNLLVFHVKAAAGLPRLSALLVGPQNDGDSAWGIRWSA